ncbi:uroporphyrinogen-III C-methyltransferase, partial [Nostocoides japonicum]
PAVVDHAGMRVGVVSHGVADPRRVAGLRDALAEHLHTAPLDLRARREASRAGGRVVLVGGGPGADDLISLRGRRVLSEADVVVTDRLGPTGLLGLLPDDVEVVDVGKTPGRHQVSQEQINAILVDHATRGRTVVRLKGGDPYVFGRGGEEHAHCAAHGIPVEVVPGVGSAVGAPATVGIPLTHRGTVGGFHVAHGHAELDAASVACVVDASATLVLLMGVATLPDQVTRLLAAGADPHTPVAVIENATLPAQRVVRAPLSGVVAAADECAVRAPAVVVIGRVADPGLLDAPDGPAAPRVSSAATSVEPPCSTSLLSPATGGRR